MSALPPLRSLEAFRAVMRQGSFTQAAESLGLTTAAISHRIRELERVLGAPLFERRNRSVFATDAAHRYHEALQEGFQRLEAATRIVSQPANAQILALHCSPSFAAQWLMPRLKRFISAHPDIVVRLSSTPDAGPFRDDVYDLDLQYGRPVPEGCDSLLVAEESIVPLCAPDYLRPGPWNPRTMQFEPMTLLHSVRNVVQWQSWLDEHAPGKPVPARNMHFDRSFMAIAAATDGLGICLESTLIAEAELASGRLVMPFGARDIKASGHRLVWRHRAVPPKKIAAFRDWLVAELARGVNPPAGPSGEDRAGSAPDRAADPTPRQGRGPRISIIN
ncbi:MAG: LysR substrate-binding domain-containing protein [Beijerinckiaceae bacterium]|jgi:LysR family glycine cleavage system transcriptional activator|nr:LysR substrate-binding domain-containing protein [Beijerinckiaceae bacterium]